MITPELNDGAILSKYTTAAAAIISFAISSGEGLKDNYEPISTVINLSESLTSSSSEFTHFISSTAMNKIVKLDQNKHDTTHLTPAQYQLSLITPAVYRQWVKVHDCEEPGNWHVEGPVYSGGLGVSNENWIINGGRMYASNGGEATPKEQMVVARKIQKTPPDQDGCSPGGW